MYSSSDADELEVPENESFVDYVTKEIDEFSSNVEKSSSVLLFPSLNGYKRMLIHQLVEKRYAESGLSTFSVGEEPRRRTVVCRTEQRKGVLDDDSNRQNVRSKIRTISAPPSRRSSPVADKETVVAPRQRKERKTMSYYVPPHLRKAAPEAEPVVKKEKLEPEERISVNISVRPIVDVDDPSTIRVTPAGNKNEIWDPKFCGKGACSFGDIVIPILDDNELGDIFKEVGNVRVVEVKGPVVDEPTETSEYVNGSIIEIYQVASGTTTDDLVKLFAGFLRTGFRLRWVDDERALGIFSSSKAADEALSMSFEALKTRPISEGTQLSQEIARSVVLPSSFRPKTSSTIAKRLLSGALGLRVDGKSKRSAQPVADGT